MKITHGGDWYGYYAEHAHRPLDFSANTSPLGMPKAVMEAAQASLAYASLYPDPLCRELRDALAARYRLSADTIVCGAGAADIIFRLAMALRPRRALVTAPAFSEYTSALAGCGCAVGEYALREADEFRIREDILDAITAETDLLLLCEPNNPTGVTTDPALLRRIAERCAVHGVTLVVDECFNDFLDCPEEHSLLGAALGGEMIVLRAFTKFYGMAGLRLGWCACSDANLAERIAAAGQPWSVSIPAQAAGLAALKESEYTGKLRALIRKERAWLYAALRSLGLRVIGGEANYLLFYTDYTALHEALRRRGILIRSCANFSGLGEGWYRVAVRTHEENEQLIAAIGEEAAQWQNA